MELLGFTSPIRVSRVTSRSEFDIQAVLERLKPHHERCTLSASLETHVVRPDPRRWRWQEEDKDLVIKTLSEKAGSWAMLTTISHMIIQVFSAGVLPTKSTTSLLYAPNAWWKHNRFPPNIRCILEESLGNLDETY
jgi:hypothetical protein